MIEGVGGIVREITGTVIFGVCKVKGKNVERWPAYVLDYIKETTALFDSSILQFLRNALKAFSSSNT